MRTNGQEYFGQDLPADYLPPWDPSINPETAREATYGSASSGFNPVTEIATQGLKDWGVPGAGIIGRAAGGIADTLTLGALSGASGNNMDFTDPAFLRELGMAGVQGGMVGLGGGPIKAVFGGGLPNVIGGTIGSTAASEGTLAGLNAYGNTNLPGADIAANPWVQTGASLAAGLAGGIGGFKAAERVPGIAKAAVGDMAALAPRLNEEVGGGVLPSFRKDHLNTLPDYPAIGPEAPLGRSGIDEAIALKAETTAKPGPLGRAVGEIPGVKAAAGVVNPSVNLDPQIHIANQAEAAVRSDIATSLSATRKPLLEQIDNAFKKTPEYIGPPENPLKGTFLDIAENPGDYVLNAEQRGVLDVIARRDAAAVNDVRARYNSDIGLYRPQNEGAIYLPHINANEDLVQRVASAEAALSNPRIAKERVWDTARDRTISDPTFKPEVKPARLLEAHDNAVASMAGKQTFKEGSGGLTLIEAKEQIRPGLRAERDAVNAQLDAASGRMDTALRRQGQEVGAFKANGAQERRIEARMAPLQQRVAELQASGDYGPELSHLSGQVYELRLKQEQLKSLQAVRGPRVVGAGEKVDTLAGTIDRLQTRAQRLADQYKAVNVSGGENPLVMNPVTYKYHTPEASNSINALKQVSNRSAIDKVTGAFGTMRATALNADASPLTIQGQLNVWRSPVRTAKSIVQMVREGGPSLDAIAREEPEMVSRYVKARGVPFGNVAPEFSPNEALLAKIPKIGPKFAAADQKMFEILQRFDYEAWKSNTGFLKKFQPGISQDVIDHEVANLQSKTVPGLSSVERGVSPARGKLERAAFTSTSFATSPALVVKDATSGLAKALAHPLQVAKGDFSFMRGRELLALRQGLTAAATIQGISAATAYYVAEKKGLDPEKAVIRALTPGSKEFMAINLPNGTRIPLGGPFRSFITGVGPTYKNGEWHEPNLLRFAQSKIAPGPRTTIDLIRNEDYQGNKIRGGGNLEQLLRSLAYVGESTLPLSAGAVATGIRQGQSADEIKQQVIGQLAGTNVSYPTPTDKLNEIARGVTYQGVDDAGNPVTLTGKDFYDLPTTEQNKIYATHPDLQKAAISGGSPQRQEAAKVVNQITAKQQSADTQLANHQISGDKWQSLYHANVDEIRLRKDEIYANAGTNPGGDKWLDGYFKALDEATLPTGELDWDKVDAYRATLPKAVNDYIDRETGLSLNTPVVKAYREATGKMDSTGYYDLRDKAWQDFKKTDPRLANLPDSYYAWQDQDIREEAQKLVDAGKDPRLAYKMASDAFASYKAVSNFSDYYRQEYRHQWVVDNPELAKTAIYYGLFSPDKAEKEFLGLKEPKK
jgi:hypothetical protein